MALGIGVGVSAMPNWAEGGGNAVFHGQNLKHNIGPSALSNGFQSHLDPFKGHLKDSFIGLIDPRPVARQRRL